MLALGLIGCAVEQEIVPVASVAPCPPSDRWFGNTLEAAGDVDGDGYADVIAADAWGDADSAGMACLYRGGPHGLERTAGWGLLGTRPYEGFGYDARGVGDLDGDGYDDLAFTEQGIGARATVLVFLGGPGGPGTTADWSWTAEGPGGGDVAVAGAGDVDGDGYGELLLGSSHTAEADLAYGGPGGPEAEPSWVVHGDPDFGAAVTGPGDLDGDGLDDVVVAAPAEGDQGAVYVFRGRPDRLRTAADQILLGSTPGLAGLGVALDAAGDVNGDGLADLLVGAEVWPYGDGPEHAHLWLGCKGSLPPAPAWSAAGAIPFWPEDLGLGGAGDTDGDGFDDLFVADGRERISLYRGTPTGPQGRPAWTHETYDPAYAWWIAAAGDIDGDGRDELVLDEVRGFDRTGDGDWGIETLDGGAR